jgi:hypothetical protein
MIPSHRSFARSLETHRQGDAAECAYSGMEHDGFMNDRAAGALMIVQDSNEKARMSVPTEYTLNAELDPQVGPVVRGFSTCWPGELALTLSKGRARLVVRTIETSRRPIRDVDRVLQR